MNKENLFIYEEDGFCELRYTYGDLTKFEREAKKYHKLQSNWNSLREYAEAHIEVCENRLSTPFCNFEKATKELMIHQNYLDKMKELEGKDK